MNGPFTIFRDDYAIICRLYRDEMRQKIDFKSKLGLMGNSTCNLNQPFCVFNDKNSLM